MPQYASFCVRYFLILAIIRNMDTRFPVCFLFFFSLLLWSSYGWEAPKKTGWKGEGRHFSTFTAFVRKDGICMFECFHDGPCGLANVLWQVVTLPFCLWSLCLKWKQPADVSHFDISHILFWREVALIDDQQCCLRRKWGQSTPPACNRQHFGVPRGVERSCSWGQLQLMHGYLQGIYASP